MLLCVNLCERGWGCCLRRLRKLSNFAVRCWGTMTRFAATACDWVGWHAGRPPPPPSPPPSCLRLGRPVRVNPLKPRLVGNSSVPRRCLLAQIAWGPSRCLQASLVLRQKFRTVPVDTCSRQVLKHPAQPCDTKASVPTRQWPALQTHRCPC